MAKKAVVVTKVTHSIYHHKNGHIAVTCKGVIIGSVSNNPKSVRYNKHLYAFYKALLVADGKWVL